MLASLPGSVGYLAAGIPAGVVVDRLDPWLVLGAGDVLRAVIFLALFLLTGARAVPVWLILALAFAAGAVTVFADTAMAIAVRDVFAGPGLVPANSWLESASQAGQIAGPSAAGLLAAAGLLHVSMLIDAATFVVSLASLAAVRRAYRTPGRRAWPASWRTLGRELAEGVRYLAATRLLAALLVFLLVLNLCLGADKLVIFLARATLHLPPALVGLVVTAGGVGGLLGAIGTGALCRRLGPLPVVAVGAAASGVALILIGSATALPVLLAGNLLYTWAIIAASVTLRALRQALVPRPLLGRVTAAWRLAGQAVTLAGAVLAGRRPRCWPGTRGRCSRRPGVLTILCAGVAWLAALRKEDGASVAVALLGR